MIKKHIHRLTILGILSTTLLFSYHLFALSTTPYISVYKQDFNGTNGSWRDVKAYDPAAIEVVHGFLATSTTYASVGGRYWLDQNHIYPEGKGTLNLWAVGYTDDLGIEQNNFENNILKVRVRAQDLTISSTSRIGLWFQTFDPLKFKYVNYFQVANTVDSALGYPAIASRTSNVTRTTDWVDVEIPFSSNDSDWHCLNGRTDKLVTYGCSESVSYALNQKIIDFGIFNYFSTSFETIPTGGTLDIDSIELQSPNPSKPLMTIPYSIKSPTKDQYVSGRKITVTGTCNPDRGNVFVAVGSNAITAPCFHIGYFSTDVNYTGGGGNVAVAIRPDSTPGYLDQYTILLNPNKTPLTVDSPVLNSTVNGRSITFTGSCDRGEGQVTVALNYDLTKANCATDSRYTAVINYTGTDGTKAFGVKSDTDGSYRVTGGIVVNTTSTPSTQLSLISPINNQIISSRDVNFYGTCSSLKGNVFIAMGNNTKSVQCINDTFETTLNFTGNSGNISVGVRYALDYGYAITRNVLVQLPASTQTVTATSTKINSPKASDKILGTRTIDVSGACSEASGQVFLALGYQTLVTPCVADKFSAQFIYSGTGGNTALAARAASATTYQDQINLLIIP